MKARVKIPYYDNLGLHKAGEIVNVEKVSNLVEFIAEDNTEAKEEPKKPVKKEKRRTNYVDAHRSEDRIEGRYKRI